MGVVVRRYIDFLILLIPTPMYPFFFWQQHPYFCSFKKMFFVLVPVLFRNSILCIKFKKITQYKHTYGRLRAGGSIFGLVRQYRGLEAADNPRKARIFFGPYIFNSQEAVLIK